MNSEVRNLEERNRKLQEAVGKQVKHIANLEKAIEYLLAAEHQPLFPAIFRGLSKADDPRKVALLMVVDDNPKFREYIKELDKSIPCWIMLSNGAEQVGKVSRELSRELKPEQFVLVNSNYNIVSVVPNEEIGNLTGMREAIIADVIGSLILVHGAGSDQSIVATPLKIAKDEVGERGFKAGDRVLVFANCVVKVLEKKKTETTPEHVAKVTFADIGGLDEQIRKIRDILGLDFDAESFEAMNEKPARGVVLFGPPGCGKTMIAKAFAHELGWFFQVINGSAIESKWVGETPRVIREAFRVCVEHKPSILFIDEADALFPVRGSSLSSEYKTSYISQINVLMQGVEDTSGVFVILATNRLDKLDPAVIREGRFDEKIYIPRYDRKGSSKILEIYFRNKPIGEEGDRKEIIERWTRKIVNQLFNLESKNHLFTAYWGRRSRKFYFKDFVSGALLANIVQKAVKNSLVRMKKQGIKKGDKRFGLQSVDLKNVVEEVVLGAVPKDYLAMDEWMLVNGFRRADDYRPGALQILKEGDEEN
jgi:proteasome-associated ATPase